MAPPAGTQGRLAKVGSGPKILGGLAILGVFALLYFFFVWSDLSKAVDAARAKHAELKTQEQAATAAYSDYVRDATKLEEKKARAPELNKALPPTAEMGPFLGAINQKADVAGLKVRSVVPLDEQVQPFYARVPVRLEVVGRFHQLAKFFAELGRLDRITNVENIEIGAPVRGDNDETSLSVKVLTTTFRAAPKTAGSAAPGAPGGPPR
jgi:type IV pilus assembly protein PilO